MKKILLTNDKFALVDDDMFDYFNQFQWLAGSVFAYRYYIDKKGNRKQTYMHREVLSVEKGCFRKQRY